ncbi:hypothetical protein M8C21_028858, partial [Ambrosia artemisiifolia]
MRPAAAAGSGGATAERIPVGGAAGDRSPISGNGAAARSSVTEKRNQQDKAVDKLAIIDLSLARYVIIIITFYFKPHKPKEKRIRSAPPPPPPQPSPPPPPPPQFTSFVNSMARVSTTCIVIPPFKQPIIIISLTSLHSKFSGLRLQHFPNLYVDRITCRYGGGRSSRLEDSARRSKDIITSDDDDQALDVSAIRVIESEPHDPQILSNTVRLIDDQQNMVGIVSKTAAIQMAEDAELDLVILSPDADPPVVKLMDYNKYRYEQQKKKREQQKKSAALRMDQKELKMGYNIDVHDYSVRLRAAQKFLKDGDKVKVIVNLKGRENEFRNNAIELLNRFRNDIGELGIEESKNLRDRNMFMVLIPNKVVVQKEPPKKK